MKITVLSEFLARRKERKQKEEKGREEWAEWVKSVNRARLPTREETLEAVLYGILLTQGDKLGNFEYYNESTGYGASAYCNHVKFKGGEIYLQRSVTPYDAAWEDASLLDNFPAEEIDAGSLASFMLDPLNLERYGESKLFRFLEEKTGRNLEKEVSELTVQEKVKLIRKLEKALGRSRIIYFDTNPRGERIYFDFDPNIDREPPRLR